MFIMLCLKLKREKYSEVGLIGCRNGIKLAQVGKAQLSQRYRATLYVM